MLGGGGSSSAADYATASVSSGLEEEVTNSNTNINNSGSLFEDDQHDRGDRSSGGNRWPRQETMALLKIRSDMDVAFRDASLKGPLWDGISRKMAELGFNRSAKKCKEKFENVYKYHKRTKVGRVTKSDAKSYRFFDQLEALDQLQPNSSSVALLPLPPQPPPMLPVAPTPILSTATIPILAVGNNINSTRSTTVPLQTNPAPLLFANSNTISFSHVPAVAPPPIPVTRPSSTISTAPQSHYTKVQQANLMLNSQSSSSSTSSDEEFVEVGRNKRKRKWKQIFERLMNEVVEKQERLQKKFLETIEKREHDRIVREESWKMQEMERKNREQGILAKERSMAAAKDAAVISFLQNISEQNSTQNHQPQPQSQKPSQSQTQPQPQPQPQPQQQQQQQQRIGPPAALLAPPAPLVKQIKEIPKSENNGGNVAISPSRWPKAEVQALINLRTSLDLKYHENGPKGPLWEDISSGMAKIGYNRSAKRCKEKWENINKYFKKVKESNKRRTEDSKTCPYFHLLDAIYKEKNKSDPSLLSPNYNHQSQMAPIMVQPEQQWPLPQDLQQQRTMQDRSVPMEEIVHESRNLDNQENDDDDYDDNDDDDDDDDDEGGEGNSGGGGYEIVTNKPAAANFNTVGNIVE